MRNWNILKEYLAFSAFSESKLLSYVFQKLLPLESFHSVYFTAFIELLSLLILKVLRLFHGQKNHAEVKASLITLLVEFKNIRGSFCLTTWQL